MATLEEILVQMAHENREVLERIATLEETNRDLLTLAEYNAKKDYEIEFFTYPYDGTRATLSAGTTTIDFAQGTIRSPSGAITKLSSDLGKKKKDFLRSVTVNANEDIVVQLDENNKIPVRANNWFTETYQQFTRVKITTTTSTDVFVLASTNPKTALEMVGETTVTKTTTGQDWTAVAQNTIVASAAYDLSEVYKAILHIQAALDTTTAHTGTRFLVQISSSGSGDEDWQDYTDFVALIGTAARDAIENDPLAAGSTALALTGHSLTELGIWLFIEDDDVAAQGTITMSGVATADETFVIDTQTFTWKSSRTGTGEVTIGASAAEAVTNIVAAVTADLATVTAVDGAGDTVVITAATAGSAGNSIVFTEASTNTAVDGTGTLGGTIAGADGTLTDSELVFESAQDTNEVDILDGTTNEHAVGTAIFNVAMTQNITLSEAVNRVRVVVDNSYDADGSTLNYKVAISKVTGV